MAGAPFGQNLGRRIRTRNRLDRETFHCVCTEMPTNEPEIEPESVQPENERGGDRCTIYACMRSANRTRHGLPVLCRWPHGVPHAAIIDACGAAP
jgi:hypothetical protein